jgi:hypothetical protein
MIVLWRFVLSLGGPGKFEVGSPQRPDQLRMIGIKSLEGPENRLVGSAVNSVTLRALLLGQG